MNAAKYDITIDRASEYDFILTVQNYSGNPVDLSMGTSFYSDIRESISKKEIMSFNAVPIIAEGNNRVSFRLLESQTLALNPNKKYEYDIFMVREGVTTCLLYGSISVRANITKGLPVDPTN